MKKGLEGGRSGLLEGRFKKVRWIMKKVREGSPHPSQFEHPKIFSQNLGKNLRIFDIFVDSRKSNGGMIGGRE